MIKFLSVWQKKMNNNFLWWKKNVLICIVCCYCGFKYNRIKDLFYCKYCYKINKKLLKQHLSVKSGYIYFKVKLFMKYKYLF